MSDSGVTSWKKSSFSGSNGCVEVRRTSTTVMIRDSKDPDGPVLEVTREAWAAFLADLRSGRYQIP